MMCDSNLHRSVILPSEKVFAVNVNTHMYKKWNILMYNNGITHLLRESPEAHACL